jgi:hypothetical protein
VPLIQGKEIYENAISSANAIRQHNWILELRTMKIKYTASLNEAPDFRIQLSIIKPKT